MYSSDGFMPIVAIFYAVFHPTEGTKIVHQVPENCIKSLPSSIPFTKLNSNDDLDKDGLLDDDKDRTVDVEMTTLPGAGETLFDFDTVKNYVIPKPQLCNRLVSFKIGTYKVIGYPVNLENSKYARNSFNFNFCFVFDYSMCDTTPFELAIQRIGRMFSALEEQSFTLSKLAKDDAFLRAKPSSTETGGDKLLSSMMGSSINDLFGNQFLSKEDVTSLKLSTPGYLRAKKIELGSVDLLINQIFQDLNNYSECCIPLDSSNLVDIKLFPILPAPEDIRAHQVPVATVKLESLIDVGWDPTMIKIMPFIDGLNSVKKISELADADYALTKQCIQHLMHYKCIIITDIFQFSNIYAPTNKIGDFVLADNQMAEECQAYVATIVDGDRTCPSTPSVKGETGYDLSKNGSGFFSAMSAMEREQYSSASPSASGALGGIKAKLKRESTRDMQGLLPTASSHHGRNDHYTVNVPSKSALFHLYCSLNQGQSVKEWYMQHQSELQNIDVRRFIIFGVLRGLIYHIHTYPVLHSITRAYENSSDPDMTKLADRLISQSSGGVRSRTGSESMSMSMSKKKIQPQPLNSLLHSKVNARTLQTMPGRKVSFKADDHATSLARLRGSTSTRASGEIESTHFHDENALQISDEEERGEDDDVHSWVSEAKSDQSWKIRHERASLKCERERASLKSEQDQEKLHVEHDREMQRLVELLQDFDHYDAISTKLNRSRREAESLISKLGSFSTIHS